MAGQAWGNCCTGTKAAAAGALKGGEGSTAEHRTDAHDDGHEHRQSEHRQADAMSHHAARGSVALDDKNREEAVA